MFVFSFLGNKYKKQSSYYVIPRNHMLDSRISIMHGKSLKCLTFDYWVMDK